MIFALSHPRWLYVLPNGDVLVAETNGPADRERPGGIRGWFMRRYFKKAGAAVQRGVQLPIELVWSTNWVWIPAQFAVLSAAIRSH